MSKLKKNHGTKAAKEVQRSERRTQSVKRSLPTAHCSLPTASVEDQLAAIEEQIAALQVQSAEIRAQSQDQRAEIRAQSKEKTNHSAPVLRPNNTGSLHSALPSPRLSPVPNLPAPVLESVMSVGSRFLRVAWTPIAAPATGYLVKYSTDAMFVKDVNVVTTDASVRAVTLSGLQPDTTYYVCVKAISDSANAGDSDFSLVKSAKTGVASNDETVTHLKTWLAGLQGMFEDFTTLIPQLETTILDTTERRRLLGSGVRRYGFIEKVVEVGGEYPQFWPAFTEEGETLRERVAEIDVLRNLLVWFRFASRIVGDLLLIAGDDAFRIAGSYYAATRDSARRRVPEARQVFQLLKLFWHRRRNPTEPTLPEVERDVRALLRGTKEGSVYVEYEGDSTVKGKRTVIDKTRRKTQRAEIRVQSGEEVRSEE